MRDEIAQIIAGESGAADDRSLSRADDILAALPALIEARLPELVWDESHIASPSPYQIWTDNGGSGATDDPFEDYEGFAVYEPIIMGRVGLFPTLEAAKAAAQAHHNAQIMATVTKAIGGAV